MNDRTRLAQVLFSFDALLGVSVIGMACVFGAAHARDAELWTLVATAFVPLSALWSLFCFIAYKGLRGGNVALRSAFWCHALCNVFIFPIGTAMAGAAVWLRRDFGKRDASRVTAA